MYRLALILIIAAASECLVPAGAAAQSTIAGCRASQWEGNTAERTGESGVSKFDGTPNTPVKIDCDDQQFFADHLELYRTEGLVKAAGNIVYVQGGNRIVAERMEFNTKTRTGVFYVASGTAVLRDKPEPGVFGTQEPDMMFWGTEIHKLGPKKYKIVRGAFTTCVQPTPRWKMVSGQITVELEDHVWMTNSLFKVKDVPLMYLPAFYYPIQKDNRATGFLLPVYGSSSIKGKMLSNAFFWAIDRSQDATIYHDWFSKAGQQIGGEYKYVAAPGSQGRTTFSMLDQHASDPGESVQLPAERSYRINGSLNQRLKHGFQARSRIDYFTSIRTNQLYQQDITRATNSQRSFQGNLAGVWDGYAISVTADRTDYFNSNNTFTTYGSLPRINVNRAEQPIKHSPLYFGVNGEFATLIRSTTTDDGTTKIKNNDQGLSRVDVLPTLRVPFTKLSFLSVNTVASYRVTYWTESLAPTGDPANPLTQVQDAIGRNYFEVSSRVTGPVFTRIFNTPSNGYAEKFKHVIEPAFGITYHTVPKDPFEIVQLDGPDYIYNQGGFTRFDYGIVNRLYAKKGTSREILSASLGQSYYTTATAVANDPRFQSSQYPGSTNSTAPNHFTPLALLVRASPTPHLAGNFRTEFDSHTNAIRTLAASGGINGSWGAAEAGWSKRKFIPGVPGFEQGSANNYLNASTTIRRAGGRVGGTYAFNYDLKNDNFLQQRYQFFYNAQCCGVGAEYQTFNFQGSSIANIIPTDHRFNLSFTLAGIGTFSNLLGAFGGELGALMKGLILSGGKGTRLRPLTYTSAKQLVPVANKPVLFYGIEALAEAGIREIGIVVGDTQAEIRAAVGDGSRWGVRITYIEQDAPRGLAHAVLISEPFIGTDPFVMYLGDNLLNKGIAKFTEDFVRVRPAAQILLARVPDPQMFGVAELDGDRVVGLVEKPKQPKSDYALVGVYMFSSRVFEAVKAIKPSFRNELEITDAIQYLIDHGFDVRPHIVDGWWKDTGKLEDMLEANRLILDTLERRISGTVDAESRIEGKVVIEEGATIEQSVVRGPVIIGARARIAHAYVGPFTSIANDVEIRDSEIEHSIVLEGSSISSLENRVEDSLIGRNVRIYRRPVKPSAFRFMLGDNSEVGIRW